MDLQCVREDERVVVVDDTLHHDARATERNCICNERHEMMRIEAHCFRAQEQENVTSLSMRIHWRFKKIQHVCEQQYNQHWNQDP